MADPQSYRPSNLPTQPGVYRFFDGNDKVIYVGKAKNIKNRLNSYFGSNLQTKTRRMVHTAVRVDWTLVNASIRNCCRRDEGNRCQRSTLILMCSLRMISPIHF